MDVSELKQLVDIFVCDAEEALQRLGQSLSQFETQGTSRAGVETLLRTTRTLRGSAATLGFIDLAEFIRQYERFLEAVEKNNSARDPQVMGLLVGGKAFIEEHIQCLKRGKRPPGKGESLAAAMQSAQHSAPKAQPIVLPRAPIAGDIWFVGDDLKAELFEIPKPPTPESPIDLTQPNDTSISAIQAEIARLTRLVAAVNQSAVAAAVAQAETFSESEDEETWSLARIGKSAAVEAETSDNDIKQNEELGATVFQRVVTPETTEIVHSEQEDNESLSHTEALACVDSETKASAENDENTPLTAQILEMSVQESDVRTTEPLPDEASQDITSTEDVIAPPLAFPPRLEGSLEIESKRINRLIENLDELVILQSILNENRFEFKSRLLQKSVAQLSKIIRETHEMALSFRLVGVNSLFANLHHSLKTLQHNADTELQWSFHPSDIEIDETSLACVRDPLISYLSYVALHEAETTAERRKNEKSEKTEICIKATVEQPWMVIEISDDGRWQFCPRISEKGIARETVVQALRTACKSMHGRVEFEANSETGGMCRIFLPISSTVVDGLVTRLGTEKFIIPKALIAESVQPHEAEVNVIQGRTQLLNLRGTTIPLFHLADLLGRKSTPGESDTSFTGIALVIQENGKNLSALVVDDILYQQKFVVRKLGQEIAQIPGLAGATILGDGKPAIILAISEILDALRIDRKDTGRGRAA